MREDLRKFRDSSRRAATEGRIIRNLLENGGEPTTGLIIHEGNVGIPLENAPLKLDEDVLALAARLKNEDRVMSALVQAGVDVTVPRSHSLTNASDAEKMVAAAEMLVDAENSDIGRRIIEKGGSVREVGDLLLNVGTTTDDTGRLVLSGFRQDPLGSMESERPAGYVNDEILAAYGDPNIGILSEAAELEARNKRIDPVEELSDADWKYLTKNGVAPTREEALGYLKLKAAAQQGYGYDPFVSNANDGRKLRDQDRAEGISAVDVERSRRSGQREMPIPVYVENIDEKRAAARANLGNVPELLALSKATQPGFRTAPVGEVDRYKAGAETDISTVDLQQRATGNEQRLIEMIGDAVSRREGNRSTERGISADELFDAVIDDKSEVEIAPARATRRQANIGDANARMRQGIGKQAGKSADFTSFDGIKRAVRDASPQRYGQILEMPADLRRREMAKSMGVQPSELDAGLAAGYQSILAESGARNPDKREVRRGKKAVTTTQEPNRQVQREATLRYETENPNMSRTMDSVSGANFKTPQPGERDRTRQVDRGRTYRGSTAGSAPGSRDNFDMGEDATFVGGTAYGKRLKEARQRPNNRISAEAAYPAIGAVRPKLEPTNQRNAAGQQGWVEKENSPHYLRTRDGRKINKPGQMQPYEQQGKGRRIKDERMVEAFQQEKARRLAQEIAMEERTAQAMTASQNIPAPDNPNNSPGPTAPTTVQMQHKDMETGGLIGRLRRFF